ncbi:hypothetical protein TcWFU_010033 [Taenia crassiceps]|uniref:Uncharacterized protein n=1 Tax=Taenia crassiceps TaxID=6207 RepID=A0ABR4Q435_9CEST
MSLSYEKERMQLVASVLTVVALPAAIKSGASGDIFSAAGFHIQQVEPTLGRRAQVEAEQNEGDSWRRRSRICVLQHSLFPHVCSTVV